MMVISSSILFIVELIYYALSMHQKKLKKKISTVTIKFSMLFCMIGTLLIGIITGVFIRDFALATIASIIISFLFVWIIGKSLENATIIELISTGLMGSTMGCMLGNMLKPSSVNVMLFFWDILFICSTFSLVWTLKKQTSNQVIAPFKKKALGSLLVSVIIPVAILSVVQLINSQLLQQDTKNHHMVFNLDYMDHMTK
ncbi:hypothetical protein EWI07_08625 [Sporolactobacillus sp. THM7-4]|nr:hypothetical protein EWI07_08625 [Sporolactobacillus sp. THM7-4]